MGLFLGPNHTVNDAESAALYCLLKRLTQLIENQYIPRWPVRVLGDS